MFYAVYLLILLNNLISRKIPENTQFKQILIEEISLNRTNLNGIFTLRWTKGNIPLPLLEG